MPNISETITIPSPLAEVWPLLADPKLVAACIPGATLSPDQDGEAWKGAIKVKFGPTIAIFKGEAKLAYDHSAHTCTIEGRGIDGRGASRALASGRVEASGTDETTLKVEGEYTVSGPLETFANAGGVHVARALLGEFAKNMLAMVAEQRATIAAAGPPAEAVPPVATPAAAVPAAASTSAAVTATPPAPATPQTPPRVAPAAELSATKLLWAAFLSWLRSLFAKRT
jgi:carbon monoxide dehydrogenase subunit G